MAVLALRRLLVACLHGFVSSWPTTASIDGDIARVAAKSLGISKRSTKDTRKPWAWLLNCWLDVAVDHSGPAISGEAHAT